MRTLLRLMSICLAALVVLTGCGGSEDPGEPTPTPLPTMAVGEVQWASSVDVESGEPVEAVRQFGPQSDQIVAVVEATWVPAGTTFTAEWSIDGESVPDVSTSVTVEETMSDAWVSFAFERVEGEVFPLGVLEVTITASSGESVTGSIEIVMAD